MRTEEWEKTEFGMTSIFLVEVQDDPVVYVSDEIAQELGLDAEKFPEVVHPHKEAFVRTVPHATVTLQLMGMGWERANPEED